MENAVSGEEISSPLVPHCAISANSAISPVLKNNNNSTGVVGRGWELALAMCFVLKTANRRGDRTAIPGVSRSGPGGI